ncbi:YfhO family protein [Pontibacter sp. BT310]|uniref:YfhO family protein n=1 Tax=Pontibacter populi TaxID=890055 RepID=A0ABS6XG92_9BACT|nr:MULTISPECIES: YfhO family protein [Pontibacter]MBJ6120145.1 YfhO family protein [Pontibacter sp. BT310]MBR0572578.1 YfhO family protein [Microvirga sp. STS03]MBW3366998.1 YfhO family protein [Pontibacter populi]
MTASINFKRDILPHLIAVLVFLLLTVVYFAPVVFEDKGMAQHDILQFRGGAQEIMQHREKTGEEALWTNSMFGGMPSYLINTRYPGDLSGAIHTVLSLNLPAMAGNIFITLLCGYILLVTLGMRSWLAIVGAIAFAFTSYNIIILEAGHNTKSLTIAYIPMVLAGLFYALRKNLWLGAALFALGLTLNLHFNHLQMTYYMLLLVIVWGIVEVIYAVKNGAIVELLKRGSVLLLAAILAVGVNFGRLATTAEYSKYSIRGKSELTAPNSGDKTSSGLDREYAFNWSYGVGETITLLIPDFYGGASSTPLDKDSETYKAFVGMGAPPVQAEQIVSQGMPTYWGPQPMTSGPVYAGAIVCFLFVLGLFIVDRRWTSWLVAGTILSLMLAWGYHFSSFNYFMFDHFPGYNKFRAVSSALVIAQITIPLLAMLALWRVIRDRDVIKELDRKLLMAGGITAGICLLVWLFGGMASFASAVDAQLLQAQYPVDAIRADREGMMKADAFRSFAFIVLALAILYFYVKNKLSATIAIAGVGVLVLVDLWTVDKRYLNNDDFKEQVIANYFQPTQADQIILQDKDDYRVFDATNPFNSARASYFHKSVGGYHGAKLRRYQDVIDRHISQNNLEVLRMLNTRYAITGDPKQPVQRVPGALGNAWFVENIDKVNTPDAELDALTGFDAETTAIVDVTKFPVQQDKFDAGNATIKLTTYEPDYLKYEYQAAQPGFVVFSEIYYPAGWQAYLDGKPVDHIRANYILRAMQVPAGKHTIEFRFEPKTYTIGNTVSLISSIILLLVIAGAIAYGFKKKQREEAITA